MNSSITDEQLRDLFGRHCECRPLDLHRGKDDHAAIHDCDTEILVDIQIALGIVRFNDIGRVLATYEARARCAALWHRPYGIEAAGAGDLGDLSSLGTELGPCPSCAAMILVGMTPNPLNGELTKMLTHPVPFCHYFGATDADIIERTILSSEAVS
jgi:hypothetical protein